MTNKEQVRIPLPSLEQSEAELATDILNQLPENRRALSELEAFWHKFMDIEKLSNFDTVEKAREWMRIMLNELPVNVGHDGAPLEDGVPVQGEILDMSSLANALLRNGVKVQEKKLFSRSARTATFVDSEASGNGCFVIHQQGYSAIELTPRIEYLKGVGTDQIYREGFVAESRERYVRSGAIKPLHNSSAYEGESKAKTETIVVFSTFTEDLSTKYPQHIKAELPLTNQGYKGNRLNDELNEKIRVRYLESVSGARRALGIILGELGEQGQIIERRIDNRYLGYISGFATETHDNKAKNKKQRLRKRFGTAAKQASGDFKHQF